MITDDLKDIPHVVIVESPAGIRLVEFDKGQMLQAHDYAMAIARSAFHGRIIVAARIRTIQPAVYANQHGT